jgi:hypothetical protein
VAADGRRPRQGEPVEGRSDRDASWNAMPEKPLFGYKAHVAVDHGSGLVRQALLTPANVSDKVPFLDLVQGRALAVIASGCSRRMRAICADWSRRAPTSRWPSCQAALERRFGVVAGLSTIHNALCRISLRLKKSR